MRLIFVSWSTIGGSGISQRQLAKQLVAKGHQVRFVVFDRASSSGKTRLYAKLSDLSVRTSATPFRSAVDLTRDLVGRRGKREDLDGLWHEHSMVPQNTLIRVIDDFEPHVVVVSSVDRWAWRRIHDRCSIRGIPTVLYVREEASLEHLEKGAHPSLLVANTPALAENLRERGFDCAFVPSVTDVSSTQVEPSRRAVLAINPIPIKGSDHIWELASKSPGLPFVAQEAWTLRGSDLEAVRKHLDALPNLEFRPMAPPGPHLYADARVLLAPYHVNSRPRVILEAQANGIPVLASDLPALVEAVGPGGTTLPLDDPDAWVIELKRLWEDEEYYAELCAAARRHAARDDMNPVVVAAQFERLVERLVR